MVIGSHIDSVPEGGNYGGDVGSMGAIEVAQTLAENNVSLRHPLEVIIFQNVSAPEHRAAQVNNSVFAQNPLVS